LCYDALTAKKIGTEVFLDKSYLVGRSADQAENTCGESRFFIENKEHSDYIFNTLLNDFKFK